MVKEKANKKEIVVKEKKAKGKRKKYRFLRLVFGIMKEFSRINWTSKKKLFYDFTIVICIIIVTALIFTGIGIIVRLK